jgi:uncharacterized membrane protein YhaH (DUF805 family)
MKWYLKVFRQYADFSGRARRKEYWMFVLFNIIAVIAVSVLDRIFESVWMSEGGIFSIGGIYLLYITALFVPGMAVTVRRLHDTGKSAWWLLIILIPIIGAIWLLILLINDSNPNTNPYGDNPKQHSGYGRRVKMKSAAVALIIASACWIFALILGNIIDSIKYEVYHFNLMTGLDLLSRVALLFAAILLLPQKRQDISKMKEASIALMIASAIFLATMIGYDINSLSHFNLYFISDFLVPIFVPAAMLFFAYTLHFKTELRKTASLILLIVAGCYLLLRIYWMINLFHVPDFGAILFITALYVLLPVSLMVLAYAFLSYNKDEEKEDEVDEGNHLETAPSSLPDNADYAVLHLSRPSKILGAMISYNVNLDDTVVYRAKNGSQTSIKITREGKHVLSAKTESRTTLPITVIFGEEYYVQCSLGIGFFVGHPKLELVKKETKSAPMSRAD